MVRPYQVGFYLNLMMASAGLFYVNNVYADLAACQNSTSEAQKNCDSAFDQVQAAKNASAANAQSAAAANPGNMNGNSSLLQNTANQGSGADASGANYCKNNVKSGCDDPCTNVGGQPGDQAKADQAKQKCEQDLNQKAAQMGQSSSNLAKNGNQSGNTANQSSGMPSIPSIPSPSPSPSPSPTPTPDPASTPTPTPAPTPTANATAPTGSAGYQSCSGPSSYLSSACSSQFVTQCAGKSASSAACQSFASRYCSSSGSTGEASPGATQSGEGLGSSFCNSYISGSASFQCNGAATASCPSCSGTPPAPGATIPDVCKMDPAFANPKISGAQTASSGGGSASGGSGGSSLSGLAASILDQKSGLDLKKSTGGQGTREGLTLGAVDGAGGGGSGNNGSNFDFSLDKFNSPKRTLASKPGSAGQAVVARVTDVQGQSGPSVFSISSDVLRTRCQAGRLLHCGPGSKGQ